MGGRGVWVLLLKGLALESDIYSHTGAERTEKTRVAAHPGAFSAKETERRRREERGEEGAESGRGSGGRERGKVFLSMSDGMYPSEHCTGTQDRGPASETSMGSRGGFRVIPRNEERKEGTGAEVVDRVVLIFAVPRRTN